MGSRYTGNTCRLTVMMVLVAIYFLVELVVGHITNSIALVADSFHMLSDLVALAVGMAAIRISKWPRSSKNTFGWQRAEVLGTLVNTVILVSLCFTILVEAIQRFIEREPVKNPKLMVGVGVGGLVINLIGLAVLWGQGHGHGHSHAPHHAPILLAQELEDDLKGADDYEHVKDDDDECEDMEMGRTSAAAAVNDGKAATGDLADPTAVIITDGGNGHSGGGGHGHGEMGGHGHSHGGGGKEAAGANHMNMKAVLLHVMADALGSVIVVISALILWLIPGEVETDGQWKLYVDPTMSVIMVTIILGSAIPLLRTASLIVLQSVPKEISLKQLKKKLENIDGIHKVHDLHVWQLQSNCIIGTVHLRCSTLHDYLEVSQKVKNLFHDFNIHCTTIQPEFAEQIEDGNATDYKQCMLSCGPSNTACERADVCCPTKMTPATRRQADSAAAGGTGAGLPVPSSPGDHLVEQATADSMSS